MRAEKDISQDVLANAVGVSRQTIIAIERGNYSPSVTLALKIAAYFGVDLEEIFYLADKNV